MQVKRENFEQIYDETYNVILRFIVTRCNDIDDINDILQDTYMEFLKILDKKKMVEVNNLNSYLVAIASNIIKRHYHKKKKDNITKNIESDENNIEIPDNFDLEENFITKENVKDVWNYIKNKDLMTAKVFYLYFALELKITEISKELLLSESNVKNKIYRTLNELKANLRKEVKGDE